MNQTIKNLLGVVGAFAILVASYAAVNVSRSYDKHIQPGSFRSFSVSGDGKATGVPDIAEFNFEVITEGGKDVAALQAKNTDAANKAIAFVKSKGIDEKDIKTQYYNVNPRYEYPNCGILAMGQACPPPSIVGYTVTQSTRIKIRDFTKIGDLMSGVVSSGANQVGALSFTIDDPSKVQNEARAEAIAKAQAKAKSIAKAGGFKLGRLLNIQEGSAYPYYYGGYDSYSMGVMEKTADRAPAPAIQPGSQDLSVNVTLQYEIE